MMATKRLPGPRDPIALAKLIGDIATGQVVDAVEDGKDAAAAALGRKGAAARIRVVSPERRKAIACGHLLYALQFRPHPHGAALHAGDGSWRHHEPVGTDGHGEGAGR